jgi:hypothetical protein
MGDESSATSSNPQTLYQTATESLLKTIISPQSRLITAQLEEDNYLLWKVQVETAVRGYGLEGFLLGTVSIPPRFITNQENRTVNNEEYTKFQRQDSLICSWLLSSIIIKLLPQVIGSKTARGIWTTVERIFNSQSAAKIMHHKRILHSIKKDNLSMGEYLAKIKTTCDLLEAAGHKITESEQVLIILSGLNDEYESVVAVISSQRSTPPIEDVHSILLAHEGRIDFKKPVETDMSINYAASNKGKNQNNTKADQQNQRSGQSYRGRGRGRWSGNNKPKCQICERIGHTAPKCYFRLNLNYVPGQNSNYVQGDNTDC